jgi:hypothetical protein
MQISHKRAVLTVPRHSAAWADEHDGERFGHSSDKATAKAHAHKRTRRLLGADRKFQVRTFGELDSFGAR